ncbi:formate dehydrogenase subunit gamma [Desulfofundulus thermocisternus]|uniref:formate dehydrogenase subunit gamma n=1 Tax=Desulfofundulus thermocisternus TaxID=42471 RepID=UPI00217EBFA8|nr:cytochrome b/b6 domain-containing protein [Desulfofundulus thermocisternus]MCS5696150.1 cytochrome b/b6 domain-containing protein [Desulfofundulus thermocisternus]
MVDRIRGKDKKIRRHSASVLFVHWAVAISTILLIFSGIGQMPVYRRYMIYKIPGLGWSADFAATLYLHYVAAAVLMFAVAYHIVFHVLRREYGILPRRGDLKESYMIIRAMFTGGKEPPSDKFLAEQRLAYAYIGFWLLVIIVTGIVKVLKNLPGINFPGNTMIWVTDIHTFATFMLIFGILAHLAAFLFKANRPLLRGMFTGRVDLEYVKHRHPLWYDRLVKKQAPSPGSRERSANLPQDMTV